MIPGVAQLLAAGQPNAAFPLPQPSGSTITDSVDFEDGTTNGVSTLGTAPAITSAAAKNGSLGGEFVIGSDSQSALTPAHGGSGATQSTVDLWFKFPTGTIALEDHTIIMVLDENYAGDPLVVVNATGGLEVFDLGGYVSTQLATVNEDTWYWLRWSFETDSSKRIRLFLGENGGEGSWVLNTTHTDANTHTKQYKIGLSIGTDAASTVHMDDIVVYEGFDDS